MSTPRISSFFSILLAGVLAGCFVSSRPAAGAEARPAWQAEWEGVIAGAKKEGKVALPTSATTAEMPNALTRPFQEKYGIPEELQTEAAIRCRHA